MKSTVRPIESWTVFKRTVNRQVKSVSEGKVLRYQRNRYVRQHGVIAKAWEDFESDSITLKELLRIVKTFPHSEHNN